MAAQAADHAQGHANERTPLLENNSKDAPIKPTPLPMASVAVLCFSRITEPIALTVIFPFVNQMVASMGVDESEVGYKAGLIEALFTFAQFCTILQWGRLSDRIGRKPVLLIGLAGCSISVFAFGLSQTFVTMVITRALAGVLNGNVGVIKSSLGELSDHSNEARAFSYLPPSWTLGAALGPIIGGFLADPAKNYPEYFGKSAFFLKYRYALPCFVGAIFPIIGIVVGVLFLKESLPKTKREKSLGDNESGSTQVKQELPSVRSVLTKRVRLTLINYAMLAFTSISNVGIFPLFLFTSVRLGGLGFSERQIGTVMSCQAVLTTSCQILFFPPLQRRFGTIKLFRFAVAFYTLGYLMYPVISWTAQKRYASGSNDMRSTYIALGVQILCLGMSNLAYSCNMLLINASAPSPQLLGTLNGIAQMLSSLVRSAGLAIGPALFAVSKQKNLLGGQAVWVFMVASSLCVSGTSWLVSDAKADWRQDVTEVLDREYEENESNAR